MDADPVVGGEYLGWVEDGGHTAGHVVEQRRAGAKLQGAVGDVVGKRVEKRFEPLGLNELDIGVDGCIVEGETIVA